MLRAPRTGLRSSRGKAVVCSADAGFPGVLERTEHWVSTGGRHGYVKFCRIQWKGFIVTVTALPLNVAVGAIGTYVLSSQPFQRLIREYCTSGSELHRRPNVGETAWNLIRGECVSRRGVPGMGRPRPLPRPVLSLPVEITVENGCCLARTLSALAKKRPNWV